MWRCKTSCENTRGDKLVFKPFETRVLFEAQYGVRARVSKFGNTRQYINQQVPRESLAPGHCGQIYMRRNASFKYQGGRGKSKF